MVKLYPSLVDFFLKSLEPLFLPLLVLLISAEPGLHSHVGHECLVCNAAQGTAAEHQRDTVCFIVTG